MRLLCVLRSPPYRRRHWLFPTVITVNFLLLVFVIMASSLLHHHKRGENSGRAMNSTVNVRSGIVPFYRPPVRRKTTETKRADDGWTHERKKGELFVTISPQGRLGNQMFQYASLLGIAHTNNRTAFVTSSSVVARYFHGVHVEDRLTSRWRRLNERYYASKDDHFDSIPEQDSKLVGFFQSWKYFSGIPDKIREAFVFKPQVLTAVRSLFDKYSHFVEDNSTFIGVHVRRSDMLSKTTKVQGYKPAPASYLKNAFSHMRSMFGNQSNFFVVSDDPDWCSRELRDESRVWIVELSSAIVHLGFLTLCDHVIMTVGTFGWWAAYLSGGHVVYYDGFPTPNSAIAKGFSRRDYYLPHWVPIGGDT